MTSSWKPWFRAALASLAVLSGSSRPARAAGEVPGWLGVVLRGGRGHPKIDGVVAGSPAERAGIRAGDVILAVDDEPTVDLTRLLDALREREPSVWVRLELRRGDTLRSVALRLADRPSGKAQGRYRRPMESWAPRVAGKPVLLFLGTPTVHLGVSIQQLTEGLRKYFRVPPAEGVLVSKVHEDTPAERAGLRAGDVILAVNGRMVADHGSLLGALEELEPGGVAHLRVMRERTERGIDVTLEERLRPQRCEGVEQLLEKWDHNLDELGEGLKRKLRVAVARSRSDSKSADRARRRQETELRRAVESYRTALEQYRKNSDCAAGMALVKALEDTPAGPSALALGGPTKEPAEPALFLLPPDPDI